MKKTLHFEREREEEEEEDTHNNSRLSAGVALSRSSINYV